MKQESALLLCAILCISMLSFGQDKNFDLSRYKFPDYKRHEMEFNFNSFGSSVNKRATFNSSLPNYQSKSQSSTDLIMNYKYVNFTRERISTLNFNLKGAFSYSKEELSNIEKVINPSVFIDANGSSRKYLKPDKYFVEWNYGGSIYSINNIRKVTSKAGSVNVLNISQKDNDLLLNLKGGLDLGCGRIENAGDLMQAHYIIEKLSKKNLLVREASEGDVFEFARVASKLKNKRFFDFRLRKIAELQSLDSLMRGQGLVDKGDIAYFTTLNDYWSYGVFGNRPSGKEFKISLSPMLDARKDWADGKTINTTSQFNLISMMQYDCRKQLNLFWERSFLVNLTNYTLIGEDVAANMASQRNLTSVNVDCGFGYFPNSRTQLQVNAGYAGKKTNFNMFDYKAKEWYHDFNFQFDTYYYLSPQLQLTASFSTIRMFSKKDYYHVNSNDRDWTTNYRVGLRYAIF